MNACDTHNISASWQPVFKESALCRSGGKKVGGVKGQFLWGESTAVPSFGGRGSATPGKKFSWRQGGRSSGRRGRRPRWWPGRGASGRRGRRGVGGGCGRFDQRYTFAAYPLSCFPAHTLLLKNGLRLTLLPTWQGESLHHTGGQIWYP